MGMTFLRWLAAVSLLPAAAPALAREWTQIVQPGDVLPGGGTFSGAYAMRAGGTVLFTSAHSDQRNDLLRWSPSAGIEWIAGWEGETSYDSENWLGVSPGSGVIRDAGDAGTVLSLRDTIGCHFRLEPSGVLVRIDPAGNTTPLLDPGGAPVGFDPGWIATGRMEAVQANASGGVAFLSRAAFDDACPVDAFAPLADFIGGPDGQGGLARVVVDGEEAPGVPGSRLTELGRPTLGESNEVVFPATVTTGPFGVSYEALLRWTAASGLSFVIREGQSVDGVSVYGQPTYVFFSVEIGRHGHIAFTAFTSEWCCDEEGLFVWGPDGSLAVRHRTGDPAPGLVDRNFASFRGSDLLSSSRELLKVNAKGDVAFTAAASPPGAWSPVFGLWAPDAGGTLRLRLRVGDDMPGLAGVSIGRLALLALSDDRRVLVRAESLGGNAYHLLIDADGSIETLAGPGGSFGPVRALYADAQLRSFAVEDYEALYASVPEPGAAISAIAAALALATLRRRA